ncbi:hypothetical protein [uncultured Legionella sp.]|uniref:hypothetical protein n=1 Tax=uncultured Legionella sp. TaxID=210934 RepID=UPI00262ABE0C|nr:hypothetical protein [uncultured Legionella sp.]
MLTIYHIRLLIDKCREIGHIDSLKDGRVVIPHLEIDLVPSGEFIGVQDNPAIFVNSMTFKRLSRFHANWVENKTLVFQKSFLQKDPIDIIGAVIHETGHAFNVAANIPNTEANAYIYEIEVLYKLFITKSQLLFNCSFEDIQAYFQRRLTYYEKDSSHNPELRTLIAEITTKFDLQKDKQPKPELLATRKSYFFFQDAEPNNPPEKNTDAPPDETMPDDNPISPR